jgi:hypothetical protein
MFSRLVQKEGRGDMCVCVCVCVCVYAFRRHESVFDLDVHILVVEIRVIQSCTMPACMRMQSTLTCIRMQSISLANVRLKSSICTRIHACFMHACMHANTHHTCIRTHTHTQTCTHTIFNQAHDHMHVSLGIYTLHRCVSAYSYMHEICTHTKHTHILPGNTHKR